MFLSGLDSPAKWMSCPVQELVGISPQVALARALRVPLRPFTMNIRATFPDTTSIVGPFSWSITGGNAPGGPVESTRLFQFAICDRIVYTLDQPQANAGSALKPISDFFFRFQSGIQATLVVDPVGSGYSVSSDYTPISNLVAMTNEAWAYGWVLNYTLAPKMQFLPSPLLTPPTFLTVTFRLWMPSQQMERFTGLTDYAAREQLKGMGIDV